MRTIIAFGLLLGSASTAGAHIHLTSPLSRTDSLTGDQKLQHCGGKTRDPNRVTQFQPGQTITVTWMETIQHPGWFRIAFQPDGDTFGIPPASNGPDGNGGAANFPTANQEGPDVAGSIVLKDRIADGTLTAEITLPSMECNNCTLQFIQVMIDKKPYTVDAASDDIYFNCADITLSNSAPPPDGAPPGPGGEAPPTNVDGGCDAGGGRGAAAAVLALGALLVARRRRR